MTALRAFCSPSILPVLALLLPVGRGVSDRWPFCFAFLSLLVSQMDLREAEKENCIGPPCKTDCQIDLPVLLCQSNQPPLWIGFGCVPIGGTTVRHFTILNSGSSSVEIQQSSFSILNDVKVLIGESELVPVSLLSGQSVAASISWSPQKNYSLRENLHISVEPNITLTLSFHGISGIGSVSE